jgi:hypothetical protein
MEPNADKNQTTFVTEVAREQQGQVQSSGSDEIKLRRWLVSFASGREWYPVGEFVALDAASAIDRAIEIFGPAADYQAEEIPWDAAPLPRPKPRQKPN